MTDNDRDTALCAFLGLENSMKTARKLGNPTRKSVAMGIYLSIDKTKQH
jgi:hypothetical protein